MAELAYVNGVFCDASEARVSINDRGFQFGDGIYEVIAAYAGRPFLMAEHFARLGRSAAAVQLDLGRIDAPLEPVIHEGLKRCGLCEAMVYIQITRGVAPRSHTMPEGLTPTVVMTFRPLVPVPDAKRRDGVKLVTFTDQRWANCFVKAITLLPNILAKSEAVRRGYHDAILVTEAGEVRECTSANLFLVHGGRAVIPPRTESILHGVTQGFLMECAQGLGIEVKEQPCSREMLRSADEVFMSGTTVEVLGITSIDDRPVGDGTVGPVTQRFQEAFRARVEAFTAADSSPQASAAESAPHVVGHGTK